MSIASRARWIHASVSRVVIHVQARSSAAAARRPSTCRSSIGSRVTIRPASVGRSCWLQSIPYVYTAHVPIYEYVCMKCESHFEELVRNGETPKCPDCSSAKVQKQLSVFATHGAQSTPSF